MPKQTPLVRDHASWGKGSPTVMNQMVQPEIKIKSEIYMHLLFRYLKLESYPQ